MTVALPGEQARSLNRAARRRRARTKVGAAAALTALLGLCGGLLWLGTPAPLVTVMSPSMEPTLGVGEIALMGAVRGTPQVGDIVELPVPGDVQRDKGYPRAVVHRITEITDDGMVVSQGDNLGNPDPFEVSIEDIDRRLVTVVPGAGRLVSFAFSPFGLIWVGSGVFFLVILPLIERSKERHQLETVETKTQLQHVVAAVADYGYHLKSHTEILIAMSQAAQDLSSVVTRLEGRIDPGQVTLLGPAPAPAPTAVAPAAPAVAAPVAMAPVAVVATPAVARTRPVRSRPLVARPPARPVRTRPIVAATRATPARTRPLTAARRQPLRAQRRVPAIPYGTRPVRTRQLAAR